MTLAALIAFTPMTRQQLDAFAHSRAYDDCTAVIEGECLRANRDGTWFDLMTADADLWPVVEESLHYLESRGLIQRDPVMPYIITLRDESEATEFHSSQPQKENAHPCPQ